jgi:hypothetical protein
MKLRISLFASVAILGAILFLSGTVSQYGADTRPAEIGLAGRAIIDPEREHGGGNAFGGKGAEENSPTQESSGPSFALDGQLSLSSPSNSETLSDLSPAPAASKGAETAPEDENLPEETHWVPSDWHPINKGTDSAYRLESDFETRWHGSASASIRFSAGSNPMQFGGIGQVVDAEKFADQRVKFSGHIRIKHLGPDTPALAALWIRADDASGTVVAFQNTGENYAPSDMFWSEATIVIDIPTTASALSYGAWITGDGLAWVDDLSLEIVDSGFPLTAPPSGVRGSNRVPKDVLASPTNLSFENLVPYPDH